MFDLFSLCQIETSRLIIRPVRPGDEHAINDAIRSSLEDLQRWMPWSKDSSFATTKAFITNAAKAWSEHDAREYPMVVIHKEDQKIICATGYNEETQPDKGLYEVGYWLHKEYQGQGLVREYVNALTRFALLALQAKQVQICTQTENVKSVHVAGHCGFQLKEIIPGHRIDCLSGKPADSSLFVCHELSQLPELEVAWE